MSDVRHLSVIKGYVTNTSGAVTSWILHDVYGNVQGPNGWGWNDGADVQYGWALMNVQQAWGLYAY